MDQETAQELITLIDSKIKRLEQSKREIISLTQQEELKLTSPESISGNIYDGASEPVRKLHQAMLALNRSISPKDLFVHLDQIGLEIPETRIRQYLMRWKGRLFATPKRGQWKAIDLPN